MDQRTHFINRRGLRLAAIVSVPEDESAGESAPRPGVLILHGFTSFKDEYHLQAWSDSLTESGFVTLRFDASGTWESEGSSEFDFRTSNYLDDAADGLSFLASWAGVDRDRIGVVGHSMGGMVATIFAASEPSLNACASIQAPMNMCRREETRERDRAWRESGWFERQYSAPATGVIRIHSSFLDDAEKFSAVVSAEHVRCPLLVVVGGVDDRVPSYHGEEIFRRVTVEKEFYVVEGSTHIPTGAPLVDCSRRIVQFFSDRLR